MKNKEKIKFSKSQIMTIVLAGIVSTIMSLGTSYASNNYLYNSSDVSYDNTASGIVATDVQGAVDELYFHAMDYIEIKNKIGNNTLTTTAETLTGGINELNDQFVPQSVSSAMEDDWGSNAMVTVKKIGKLVVVQFYGDNKSGNGRTDIIKNGLPTPSVGSNFSFAHYIVGGAGIDTYWGYISNGKLISRSSIPNNDSVFGTFSYITTD